MDQISTHDSVEHHSTLPPTAPPRVALIGPGIMGLPIAVRLRDSGYELVVYARSPESEARLAGAALAATTDSRVVADSDIVIVCLATQDQVRSDVLGASGVLAGMRAGSILVIHTTCSPDMFDELVSAAHARQVEIVDAPLEGVPTDFADGRGKLHFGATPAAEGRVRALFSVYAAEMQGCGSPGAAQKTKLINVLLTAASAHLVEAAVALARELGLDAKRALEAVAAGGSSATSILSYSLQFADEPGAFVDAIRPFLAKDVANYATTLAEVGASSGLLHEAAEQAASGAMRAPAAPASVLLSDWERPH